MKSFDILLVFVGILTLISVSRSEPGMQCCKVHGDPHILTFDKYAYDYMGSGTFILAQDAINEEWRVYGVFKRCGDKTKQLSCIVGITVIYGGEMVQFLRMYRINYKGMEYKVEAGSSAEIGEILVQHKDMKYEISIGSTGVMVYWDGLIVSQICIPNKCGGGVEGMCGNADCDSSNEFAMCGCSSSGFGNGWVVKGNADELEPYDGALSPARTRPCDYVTAKERTAFELRCAAILDLSVFQGCMASASFDTDLFTKNCMFDSCSGLLMGAGCTGDHDGQCTAEIETKIYAAIAGGMSETEARAKHTPKALDAACMAGLSLAEDCRAEGYFISRSWVYSVNCPADEELTEMRVCP